MAEVTRIIGLRMSTAEATAVSFALLTEASQLCILAREEQDFDKRAACYRTRQRIMDVRARIDSALTDRPIGGACVHGVAFSTQCPQCLGYFSRG